jgi:hypothetical protein
MFRRLGKTLLFCTWNAEVPLNFELSAANNICVLSHWTVTSHDEFITALAWLYIRKPLHAARIIEGLEPGEAGLFGNVKQNVIKLLSYEVIDIEADLASTDNGIRQSAEKKRDARISHRDGLLFQHISWIAAHLQFPSAEASPPHVRKADKGFDGFLVDVDTENVAISRVIICEDKASTSPRGLVTSRIWPDLKSIVAGERDAEALDAITPLLKSLTPEQREIAIQQIIWNRARHFRIALTAGANQIQDGAYNHLFAGYEDNASGEVSSRLADVMPMEDVRNYLDDLAQEIIVKLEELP